MSHSHNAVVSGIKISVGPPIPDGDGHYHLFGDNERTSTDMGGLGHVHSIKGRDTSISIEFTQTPAFELDSNNIPQIVNQEE